jgi:hypothetical protein
MDINDQSISLAEVGDRADGTLNGTFKAKIKALGSDYVDVNYVSPYASNTNGGFVAIPEEGVEILVCSPLGTNAWYYMGSTFAPEPEQVIGSKLPDAEVYPLARVDPENYKARGVPMRMSFKSVNGAGLTISEEYNPKFINRKTELTSTVNKTVSLIDSPGIDAIILDSGNGAKITLTDDPKNQSVPSRALQIETVGPQKYLNIESQTDILVKDGRELQLINQSTGAKAPEGEPDKAGNVNIQSDKKDVNIFTKAEEGRIFIECISESGNNQVIEIQTNGEGGHIRIKTKGKVDIDAKNIGINAAENIDIKAGGNIRMDSGGFTSILAKGNINADGAQVQLNGGLSTPSVPNITNSESYYGNDGVTTY